MPGKQANGTVTQNGTGKFNFDPDDPEYIRDMQRPAVIKEDMNEMERRKRVNQILDSKNFRKELEQLVELEKARGNNPEHLKTLEQLSQIVMPKGQLAAASLHGMNSQAVVPISDLRGPDLNKYCKTERALRNRLAALYRLVDLFQWSQGIYNHITLRLEDSDEFLINPFGLLYHEVTASSLIKVDMNGTILDAGTTNMGINQAGYVLHSAIHSARPEIKCVVHLHTPVVGAVSAMKCGLLPISQEAMIIGRVSYHDFKGIVSDDESQSIVDDLGPVNKVMLLRNHGFVALGQSVAEALHLAYHTVLACETQVVLMANNGFLACGGSVDETFHITRCLIQACEQQIRAAKAGIENLVIPSEAAQKRAYAIAAQGGGGVLREKDGSPTKHEWKVGELEWEAWMRVLDNAGFRTGHLYKQPFFKAKAAATSQADSDVAVPPSSAAYGEIDEVDCPSAAAARLEDMRCKHEKTQWLNTPNNYQKVEFLEEGTSQPKKITKWVARSVSAHADFAEKHAWVVDPTSPSHGTLMKITVPNQFTPLSMNPKEFKDKQKAIKAARAEGGVSSGPKSHVLEGVTYEELQHMKDGEISGIGASDKIVMIGTASKGIIERDFQHNAQVYRQLYAPNPFSTETDEDIQKYMREVQAKSRPSSAPPVKIDRDGDSPTAGMSKETTFGVTLQEPSRLTEKPVQVQPSSSKSFFQRSKSERFSRQKDRKSFEGDLNTSKSMERPAASDDESHTDGKAKKEKKKKHGWVSFLRGKKDKKKKAAEA